MPRKNTIEGEEGIEPVEHQRAQQKMRLGMSAPARANQERSGAMLARTTPRNPQTVGAAHCRFLTPHEDNRYDPVRRASGSSPLQQPTHRGVSHVPVTPPHGRVTRPSPPLRLPPLRSARPSQQAKSTGAAKTVTPQAAAGRPPVHLEAREDERCRGMVVGRHCLRSATRRRADVREGPQHPWKSGPQKAMRPKGKTSGVGTDAAAVRRDGKDDRGQDVCWRDGVPGGGTRMGRDALSSNKDCLAVDLHVPRCGQLEHILSKVRLSFGGFLNSGPVGTQLPRLQHQPHQWHRQKS